MADLTVIEKRQLESLFSMDSGYVIHFSNQSFKEFVYDSVGRDILDKKYSYASSSKANRLRALCPHEPNHIVGKLINDMVDYVESLPQAGNPSLINICRNIATRLLAVGVSEMDAIIPNAPGEDFERLAKSVREFIERNEPQNGLDRLHTFVIKYIRTLCLKHKIKIEGKPLHSLLGEYIKYLHANGKLESNMTERILKSAISTLEAFNKVRNDRSLAHDNQILNYNESLLIFNHTVAIVQFIEALEVSRVAAQEGFDEEITF